MGWKKVWRNLLFWADTTVSGMTLCSPSAGARCHSMPQQVSVARCLRLWLSSSSSSSQRLPTTILGPQFQSLIFGSTAETSLSAVCFTNPIQVVLNREFFPFLIISGTWSPWILLLISLPHVPPFYSCYYNGSPHCLSPGSLQLPPNKISCFSVDYL